MNKEEPWWGDQKVMWGTQAWAGPDHNIDISRHKGDFFWVTGEDDDFFVGSWLTGIGFIGVRFPKASARELNWVEVEWLKKHTLTM